MEKQPLYSNKKRRRNGNKQTVTFDETTKQPTNISTQQSTTNQSYGPVQQVPVNTSTIIGISVLVGLILLILFSVSVWAIIVTVQRLNTPQ